MYVVSCHAVRGPKGSAPSASREALRRAVALYRQSAFSSTRPASRGTRCATAVKPRPTCFPPRALRAGGAQSEVKGFSPSHSSACISCRCRRGRAGSGRQRRAATCSRARRPSSPDRWCSRPVDRPASFPDRRPSAAPAGAGFGSGKCGVPSPPGSGGSCR